MKSWFALALILLVPLTILASPDENTVGGLIQWLVILAFMTPFGWGALLVIVYLIVTTIVKGVKKSCSEDRSVITNEEREVAFKQEIRQAYKNAIK